MKKLKNIVATIVSLISGLLGAIGGSKDGNKGFRRFGIPGLLITIGMIFNVTSAILSGWIPVLLMGHGIPSSNDSGSWLGRLWFKLFKGNTNLADYGVKTTKGVLFALVLVILGLVSGNIGLLFITVPIAILSQVIFGGVIKNLGQFKFFGMELTGIEFARYATLGIAGIIQTIF